MKVTEETMKQEISYSYANLPPSMQAATGRLDGLEGHIAMIKADLRGRAERDFPDTKTYDDWKFSASRALGFRIREKNFLLRWIEKEQGKVEKAEKASSDIEKRDTLDGYVTEFFRLVTPYTCQYNDQNEPKDIIEAKRRRDTIAQIRTEYHEFLSYLQEESTRMECPGNYLQAARAKVVRGLQKMENEIHFIKRWSREANFKNSVKKEGAKESLCHGMPSPDSPIWEIRQQIANIKKELNMDTREMVIWLHELIMKHKDQLALDEQQSSQFEGISTYVETSKRCIELAPRGRKADLSPAMT